jgi:hypothetical protein
MAPAVSLPLRRLACLLPGAATLQPGPIQERSAAGATNIGFLRDAALIPANCAVYLILPRPLSRALELN